MDIGADNPKLDTVYELLSESRRRYVLYHVLNSEHIHVEGLSLQIAAREQDTAIETVSEERKESVTLSLVHNHLPRLADHEIIRYDGRSGDITTGDNFDAVRSTVKRAKEAEGVDSIVSDSTESFLYSDPLTESTNTE